MSLESGQGYWESQYANSKTGWDIGYASPALVAYADQLSKKSLNILIPGSGRGWEAGYLMEQGFTEVYYLDYVKQAADDFLVRYPEFPESQVIVNDFFSLSGQFDLILEQTFFSAIPPDTRGSYAEKCHQLLNPGGKLVGLFFNHEFTFDGPPFGGTNEAYRELFAPYFYFDTFETAYNSIKPRQGRETFAILRKK